jgi:hypothetical protein
MAKYYQQKEPCLRVLGCCEAHRAYQRLMNEGRFSMDELAKLAERCVNVPYPGRRL